MPTKSVPLEALLTFINSNNLHNRDYSNKFAPFTNLKFIFMVQISSNSSELSLRDFAALKDLSSCVSFMKHSLNQLETYLEMNMDFVESDMEKAPVDSILFRNYNTCGYLLASIRDILNEFEKDGK